MSFNKDEFRAYLLKEYHQPFTGWDFSYIDGRYEMVHAPDTWDFQGYLRSRLLHVQTMLDIDTGGGEWLANLQPLPARTYATESYPPNVPVARQHLEPLGVTVCALDEREKDHMPFADEQFDLIMCRHGHYVPQELWRILKPGQQFVTQQVGGEVNKELHTMLDAPPYQYANWTLPRAVSELQLAGFQILDQREAFLLSHFNDIGALVYYLKCISWQIPDFSVEKYFDKLLELHQQIQEKGALDTHFHQFFIVAQKP